MSQKAQLLLEKKFTQLKESLTVEQWNDSVFLLTLVKDFEEKDVVFAFRLMQRVKNMSPTDENQSYLDNLRRQAVTIKPELSSSASTSVNTTQEDTYLSRFIELLKLKILKFDLSVVKTPFFIVVLAPFLLFAMYQLFIASPRFESRAQVIVKEPNGMATLDPALAFMSGFGVSSGNLDTELVKAYIYSNDMISYLEKQVDLKTHYSDSNYDYFSRLENNASRESLYAYIENRIDVQVEEKSQVISIFVQGFTPKFTQKLTTSIVERAEWYINEIGHNLAKEQLSFVEGEHKLVEKALQDAKSKLISFQRRHNLLDPEAEGMALQQIAYSIEAELAAVRTQIGVLKATMSDKAPQVIQLQDTLNSLNEQLASEKSRLISDDVAGKGSIEQDKFTSLNQVLARFTDYKINLELALKSYTASQISLEKSRIEAYRQLKYLVTVEAPVLAEEAKYPNVTYNVSLFGLVLLLIFGIGRIIFATVSELR